MTHPLQSAWLPEPPKRADWLAGPVRVWRQFDALTGRLFRLVGNPLHQSGTIAILGFLVMIASGLILLIFYQIDDPWGSTAAIERDIPLGSWLRALHRYGADIAIVATGIHALRMLIAGRIWGARSRAWWSGLLLTFTVLLCGWTGLMLVWDAQGLWVGRIIAQMIDVLPILPSPLSRLFAHPEPPARAFFFLQLFLHVAMPLGLLALMLIHVSNLQRPALLPPKRLTIFLLVTLGSLSFLIAAPLGPQGDPLALTPSFIADFWYIAPLQFVALFPPGVAWLVVIALFVASLQVPRLVQPVQPELLPPSQVDENRCTGCTTCYEDCPYGAISMVPRAEPSPLSVLVARVDPDRCVSCGICTASCAPMGIGPEGRTGRQQIAVLREALREVQPADGEVVVFACQEGIGPEVARAVRGTRLIEVGCAGAVHTAAIEGALRNGAAGVAVLACPHRDAFFREGPKWLEARVFHGREADLKPRVDRARIKILSLSTAELAEGIAELSAFHAGLAPAAPMGPAIVDECKPGEGVGNRAEV